MHQDLEKHLANTRPVLKDFVKIAMTRIGMEETRKIREEEQRINNALPLGSKPYAVGDEMMKKYDDPNTDINEDHTHNVNELYHLSDIVDKLKEGSSGYFIHRNSR